MNIEFGSFIAISLAAALSPGASTILAMNNGMNHGIIRSGAGIAGHFTGVGIYISVSILVLLGFVAVNEILLGIITILGSVYIFYLGFTIFKNGVGVGVSEVEASLTGKSLFIRSLLTVLSNPKAILYFVAVLPSVFVPKSDRILVIIISIYSASLLGMMVYTLVGFALAKGLNLYVSRYVSKASGAILIIGGVLMLLAGVRGIIN